MTLNNRTFTLLKIVLLIIISIFIAEIIVLPKIEHDMLQEAGRQELVTVQQICGAVLENYPDVEQDFILGLRQPTNSLQEKGEQILKQYGYDEEHLLADNTLYAAYMIAWRNWTGFFLVTTFLLLAAALLYFYSTIRSSNKEILLILEQYLSEDFSFAYGLDIDYILVYKLSRFGRNAADILNSLELVQSYGVNLICIEEGIDSSQTSGKLLISVLSAVAEIERENIIEQTMNGRREKARQGGWNGGFAPYGYTLEDNKLMIEETEAVAIRKIFELYTSSEIGLGGIANQLNLQGIRKIPRQNGTLEDWTGHFIKLILDNPVYCGKIAYGRRTKEKVKGTKNDYQMKRNDDYILTEGQHKGIVSEEVWEKAHAKRLRTGVKQPSKIGRDRVHLLSGLLKCPVCGSPMYTNKHAWTNKDGTYKEIYYYVCSRNRMVRGKHCEYKAMLKKTDIEPMVIEAIREIVRNEEYAQAIKKRIGVQIDTKAVDKELEGYQAKLKEVDLNKTRLEREIDSLPADAKYRERKLHDMTLRLDSLYDVIVELEEKIEDARLRRDAIKQQAITLENIYKIMVNFDCVYNIINDEEKRNVVTALIKEIEIYRNDESEYPLKRIGLNFPVFKDGGEVTELLWDKGNTVDISIIISSFSDLHSI